MPDPLPFEVRFPNVRYVTVNHERWKDGKRSLVEVTHPEGNDRVCRWCATTGLVVVAVRDDGEEEHGPCPFCQLGHVREFPQAHGLAGRPYWPGGFWQGREPVDLEPLYAVDDPPPLPAAESRARMRALTQSMSGAVKSL